MEFEKAHLLFREAVEDRSLCSWCFHPKRVYHPEWDEMEAKHFHEGMNTQIFEAKGHHVNEDGEIEVNYSTSDPHPSNIRAYPPSNTVSTAKNICQCGVIDYGNGDRSLSFLHSCLDNLVDWYQADEFFGYPEEINEQAAHDIISRLRGYDSMSGQDEMVLTEALRQGFERSND